VSKQLRDLINISIPAYSGNKRSGSKMRVMDNAPFALIQHLNPLLAPFVLFQFAQYKYGCLRGDNGLVISGF
jgi:hypothetical protein